MSYERQGYIYFKSRRYSDLCEDEQRKIVDLCIKSGGENYKALFEFVTSDATATQVSMKYYIGKATLYRMVKRYYESFPDEL